MAFGAFIAARRLELAIPGDVSLVGVDDHEVAEVLGLTTVRQRVVDHGALAARTLLRCLADEAVASPAIPTAPGGAGRAHVDGTRESLTPDRSYVSVCIGRDPHGQREPFRRGMR